MTTQANQAELLLSPQQVLEKGLKHFRVLDASFHLPNAGRSAFDEFKRLPRIPHAQFFDHELIADTNYKINDQDPGGGIKLAHMQPDLVTFKKSMESLGIKRDHHVLFYDSVGIFSAPRAAWLLDSYGHPKVSVLDGGLPRWIKENGPLEHEAPLSDSSSGSPSEYEMQGFDGNRARQMVISYDDLVRNFETVSDDDRLTVLDARPKGRFLGTGHMPHSISLPSTDLLTMPKEPDEPYRKYLSAAELEKVFLDRLGDDHEKWGQIKRGERGLVVSCGSGMTACIIWLGLRLCGAPSTHFKLYDESWTGYALRHGAVIQKSPPA